MIGSCYPDAKAMNGEGAGCEVNKFFSSFKLQSQSVSVSVLYLFFRLAGFRRQGHKYPQNKVNENSPAADEGQNNESQTDKSNRNGKLFRQSCAYAEQPGMLAGPGPSDKKPFSVQPGAAIAALYRLSLYFFGAEGTFF